MFRDSLSDQACSEKSLDDGAVLEPCLQRDSEALLQRVGENVSRKLFVGGLAWGTDNDGLYAAFAEFGEVVEAKVIYSRDDGRSRGFGFVTYNDAETAQSALQQSNGMQLDGRTLRVDSAEEKPPRRDNDRSW